MKYHYVYILRLNNNKFYVGKTDDLSKRINEHQLGKVPTTKPFLPCRLITYMAFSSKIKAAFFEKYLKTGSGFAFKKKHLV